MAVLEKLGSPNERVEHYFRQVLLKADHGQRLPSVREAMKECKASRVMVDKALSRLQGEGLIETRERAGLFRAKNAPCNRVVDLLFCGYVGCLEKGTFHSDLFSALTSALTSKSQSLRMRVMRKDPRPQAYIDSLINERTTGVLCVDCPIEFFPAIQKIKDAGIPCLYVFPNVVEPVPGSLEIDDEDVVRQQLDHLVGLGHRRIGFLHAVEQSKFARPIWRRPEIFYRLAYEYRLEINPEWVRYVGWDYDPIREGVRAIMTPESRPTALIIYDNHVSAVYKELNALGLQPGKNVSIIGTDDLPHADHVDPPLTTIRVSRTKSAEMIINMLETLQAGQDPGIQKLKTKLVVRGSTCAV